MIKNFVFVCFFCDLSTWPTIFQSCRDGAITSWDLTSTLGSQKFCFCLFCGLSIQSIFFQSGVDGQNILSDANLGNVRMEIVAFMKLLTKLSVLKLHESWLFYSLVLKAAKSFSEALNKINLFLSYTTSFLCIFGSLTKPVQKASIFPHAGSTLTYLMNITQG